MYKNKNYTNIIYISYNHLTFKGGPRNDKTHVMQRLRL